METVFVVIFKTYNFDNCNSYSKDVISLRTTHKGAIESAEAYVSAYCKNVKWNIEQDIGKVDVIGEMTIEEMSIID